MFRRSAILLTLSLATVTAQAALLGRAALTPGGTDYQAYYDDVLNITWLADANLADTNDFGVAGINDNGTMAWPTAQSWIGAMNSASYLGTNNWRLSTATDTGTAGCNFAYTGTDCGYNVDLSTGEMAHMFYSTLGNTGYYDTSGSPTGCAAWPNYCLTNAGPFSNLQPYYYWYGTEDAAFSSYGHAPGVGYAWIFYFGSGSQSHDYEEDPWSYAWAVREGDIGIVPIPASVYLFGSALGLMGVIRRNAKGI